MDEFYQDNQAEAEAGKNGFPPPSQELVGPDVSAREGQEEDIGQYVTFFIGVESFAFPMESVREIIRIPETVRVPLTPASLLGLSNLRGTVLPVLETRRLLALPEETHTDASRVVVTDCGKLVGLVVDRVERVISVEKTKIEDAASIQTTIKSDLLTGVVKGDHGHLLQLLDVSGIVSLEFDSLIGQASLDSGAIVHEAQALNAGEAAVKDENIQLVSFILDEEEYALEISEVQEIVRVPDEIKKVPRADHHVLGIINLRDRLLSLVSLRRMFGLPVDNLDDHNRIIVATLSQGANHREAVGIIVDEVREVLTVPAQNKDHLPALLKRGGQFEEIKAVCRLDEGKRLVSVLSAGALFHHPAVQAALSARLEVEEETEVVSREAKVLAQEETEIQLVIFQLAGQEFGVMIESVQEIIRVPDAMTRVPKTPVFIEGMVNLRGTVLPVLDMRVRFDLARAERNDRQRILVLDLAGSRTGFIVDSVTEVLRINRGAIESSPRMSEDQVRIMGRVANLKDAKRMILVLDIAELLNEEEMKSLTTA